MTTPAQPVCITKRKRADVKYYESSSSESESEEHGDAPANEAKRSPRTISLRPLPKRKIFPFTSLPAELRNKIYHLALVDADGIDLISKTRPNARTVERTILEGAKRKGYGNAGRWAPSSQHSSSGSESKKPSIVPLAPEMLLLNKEIHAEAQAILYGSNAFFVEDTTTLHAFLANIGSENCKALLHLTILGWGFTKAHKPMNYPGLTLLKEAINLRRLRIDCTIAAGGNTQRVAKQLYRDGVHWFHAVAKAKGKQDAALDILEVAESNWVRRSGGRVGVRDPQDSLLGFQTEMRKLLRR